MLCFCWALSWNHLHNWTFLRGLALIENMWKWRINPAKKVREKWSLTWEKNDVGSRVVSKWDRAQKRNRTHGKEWLQEWDKWRVKTHRLLKWKQKNSAWLCLSYSCPRLDIARICFSFFPPFFTTPPYWWVFFLPGALTIIKTKRNSLPAHTPTYAK